jgi:hypothetical protein
MNLLGKDGGRSCYLPVARCINASNDDDYFKEDWFLNPPSNSEFNPYPVVQIGASVAARLGTS